MSEKKYVILTELSRKEFKSEVLSKEDLVVKVNEGEIEILKGKAIQISPSLRKKLNSNNGNTVKINAENEIQEIDSLIIVSKVGRGVGIETIVGDEPPDFVKKSLKSNYPNIKSGKVRKSYATIREALAEKNPTMYNKYT